MSKKLVAYFSASGITAKVAEDLADAIGADIFEIRPEVPYTKADLNWMDKKSRSTIEMSNPDSRPAIAAKRDNMDEYDTIFVGLTDVALPLFQFTSNAARTFLPISRLYEASEKSFPDSCPFQCSHDQSGTNP